MKDNFINVLADNIGFLLPTERIYLYPWRVSVPIDYQVSIGYRPLRWPVGRRRLAGGALEHLRGPEKKLLKTNRSSIREPVSGADYAALVAAQSRALGKLSQEIAEAIKSSGRN